MISNFMAEKIVEQLPFTPNEQQAELISRIGAFVTGTDERSCFLLKGYAGTGKTSIVAALVRAMKQLRLPTRLLAPTGRAAKVLAAHAETPAYTIHKHIYRQRTMLAYDFGLAPNLQKNTLFLVDEASMIANRQGGDSNFGSGCLLDDLVQYVYSGDGCRLLLLGDTAQLPPVGQSESVALNRSFIEGYGLHTEEFTLTMVARQALESGILYNATQLRRQMAEGLTTARPRLELEGRKDIVSAAGQDVQELLQQSYDEVGMEDTLIVTRTNRRATLYNQAIRARVLWKEDSLSAGDRLMITRNNYYWTEQYEGIDFLANGDMLDVQRISHHRELYGFHFADLSLRSVDYDWEIDVTALLESLTADTPDAVRDMQNQLFAAIAEDYPEIRDRRTLVRTIMQSPYYNAVQVKFSYAVTCHKAQGGQWKHVYIDAGTLTDEQITPDYYRWLYTALTRATERVYLINY